MNTIQHPGEYISSHNASVYVPVPHTPAAISQSPEEATTSDWESVAKSMWDRFPLFGDWIMFIHGLIAKERTQAKKDFVDELRGCLEMMKYGQPMLGTSETTERVMTSIDKTLDDVIALLPEQESKETCDVLQYGRCKLEFFDECESCMANKAEIKRHQIDVTENSQKG